MTALVIKCEACGKKFTTETIRVDTRVVVEDLHEHYFSCPKCDAVFPIAKTNGKIRGLQRKQANIEKIIKDERRQITPKELIEWAGRQRRIKELMDTLNNKTKRG